MQQRIFDQPTIEQQIKDVFYNALVNHVFDHGDFNRENLEQKIKEGTANTIRDILELSKNCTGIRLPTGKIISLQACPERYKPLFSVLLQLKSQQVSDTALMAVAGKIMQLDSFQAMNPTQFLLEATGQADPVLNNIHYDESGVTPQLIRDTFYNEMVVQTLLAVQNDWISAQDLEEQEPNVYMALPALTILEAIQQSQQCDGIRLLNGKGVNNKNCPPAENFPALVQLILSVKGKIKAMSDDELLVVKHMLSCDKELPEPSQHLKTPELMASVAVIKNMAIEITRRRVFNEMIGNVLAMCLDTFKPQAPTKKN